MRDRPQFDRLDHQVMLQTLGEKIHDNLLLRLVGQMLAAGLLEDWVWKVTLSGAPQGGVLTAPTQKVTSSSSVRFRGRRAFADEYAVRVNRAVELLAGSLSPADVDRGLQAEHGLSERQARRYVNAALERPERVAVPERAAVFTVRLAPSLIAGLRRHAGSRGVTLSATVAEAVECFLGQVHERRGGQAS